MDGLEICFSDIHGRGVFATRSFAAGTTVERCPVVIVPATERHLLDNTHLFNYYFYWEGDAAAIALGYGSLYNHSAPASARYCKIFDAEIVEIMALRDIEPGYEITIDYTDGGRMSYGSRYKAIHNKRNYRFLAAMLGAGEGARATRRGLE
jgi:uncharacterized protein